MWNLAVLFVIQRRMDKLLRSCDLRMRCACGKSRSERNYLHSANVHVQPWSSLKAHDGCTKLSQHFNSYKLTLCASKVSIGS